MSGEKWVLSPLPLPLYFRGLICNYYLHDGHNVCTNLFSLQSKSPHGTKCSNFFRVSRSLWKSKEQSKNSITDTLLTFKCNDSTFLQKSILFSERLCFEDQWGF